MRIDPLTKEQFEPKRIGQRFANPQNRIKFHNLNSKNFRQSEAFVNKPLHTNHRICIELLRGKKEATFHSEYLLGKGFSLGIVTHYENYNGKNERAVYGYIWINLENDQIKIIKLP